MLGMKIVFSGLIVGLAALVVFVALTNVGNRNPPQWVQAAVVAGVYGGGAAVVVGLLMAVWGV